jgi:hypothetical protein
VVTVVPQTHEFTGTEQELRCVLKKKEDVDPMNLDDKPMFETALELVILFSGHRSNTHIHQQFLIS